VVKALGIDYGTRRIGVAVSYASLAQPLTILDQSDQLFPRLLQLLAEHHIKHIVVGISENRMATATQEFVTHLRQLTAIPVTLIDETLSSHQVHEYLKTAPAHKRAAPIDHLAAAVILQDFLDTLVTSS
jgi:putative Holliday junction resolvase